MPVTIHFPCAINIDEEIIFIIGPHVTSASDSITAQSPSSSLVYYLFNQTNQTYVNVTETFPCEFAQLANTKVTCAYLGQENSVVVGVDYCTAVLNLTSLNWIINSTSRMEYQNGVIFNHDEAYESAIYIGSKAINGTSAVYQVGSVVGITERLPLT